MRANYVFKLNAENHAKFKRYCFKNEESMSDIIDDFIERFLQLKGINERKRRI